MKHACNGNGPMELELDGEVEGLRILSPRVSV